MSIIPILKSKEVIAALVKAGFRIVRQSGSHVRLKHLADRARQTSVPLHGRDMPRWLLSRILKQAKVSVKELLRLLGK